MEMNHNTMDKLFIVVPAYNEEENLEKLIADWYPIVEKCGVDSRLVVIDDGSRDKTYQIICDLAQTHSQLIPLTKENGGHGSTLIYGYKYAIENSADYIFQTDSDGQTNPDEFETFWELRNDYDAILGHRSSRGDGVSRALVEKVVCLLLRIYFGVKVPDANAPFRLMKADLVAKYIDRFKPNYNLPNIMLTTFFAYYKEKIKFIEVSFASRQGGVNTINFKKIFKIGLNAIKDFREFKKELK